MRLDCGRKTSTYDISCDTRLVISKGSRYRSKNASVRLGRYLLSWAVIQSHISIGKDGIIFRIIVDKWKLPMRYHMGGDINV